MALLSPMGLMVTIVEKFCYGNNKKDDDDDCLGETRNLKSFIVYSFFVEISKTRE